MHDVSISFFCKLQNAVEKSHTFNAINYDILFLFDCRQLHLTDAKNGLNGLTCAAFEEDTKKTKRKTEAKNLNDQASVVAELCGKIIMQQQLLANCRRNENCREMRQERERERKERERKNLPPEKCLKGDNPVDDYHREQAARVAVRSAVSAVGSLRSSNGSTSRRDLRSGYDQMQQWSDTSRALEVIIFIIIVLLLASVRML